MKTKHSELVRFPYNFRRKRTSVIIDNATGNGGYDKRLYCIGGAEEILDECSHQIDASRHALTPPTTHTTP